MAIVKKKRNLGVELTELAAELRRKIEAEVTGLSSLPADITLRRNTVFGANGFEFFCNTYFPHYVRHKEKSQLHNYLFDRLPKIVSSEKSEVDAIAAPRGEAKSTIVSQLFALWCILTGRKKYIVIVMDSIDQAYPMLEAIKSELAFNPRIALDFPEAAGGGRVWQAAVIITANGVKVQVAGSGKKLRGLRHGPFRPDLCVLDDIENDDNVASPEQRDKLDSWLKKTVLPLGGAGSKFDVVYIGTILHYDSVLSRTLNNKLWKTARFKAILRWPDNMSLWDAWETLLKRDGEELADEFYSRHKEKMDVGSEVSWSARPILVLMKIRARDGHSAFDSEYQNDPANSEDSPFAKIIDRCYWGSDELPDDLIMFGACDPSLGKLGKSRDPSALLVGGFSRKTGVLYVIEAEIKKRLPDRIISDIIALQQKYRCALWVVETVQFQAFLHSELVKRAAIQGIPVPARGVTPVADKLLRIETLQPHMMNGLIKIGKSHIELTRQLRHFPKGEHDDGPDALHMLWMAATTGLISTTGLVTPPRGDGSGDSRHMC